VGFRVLKFRVSEMREAVTHGTTSLLGSNFLINPFDTHRVSQRKETKTKIK
jgi:hypothetical protein